MKFDIENIHSNENYDVNSGMFTCYTHGKVLPPKCSSLELTNFSQSRSWFSGVYRFFASFNTIESLGVVITKNDDVISPLGYVTGSNDTAQSLNVDVISECGVGEEVGVKVVVAPESGVLRAHLNGHSLHVFGGYLLFPLSN